MASAKDLAELLPIATSFFISETGKGEFTEAEKLYASDRQLSHFEVVFERSLARRSLKAMYRSVMSIGALVGMIFLKEEEMHNIQKIVRGKALGLPQEKVSGMLILVG
ncbi:MAG: V-type ATPase subunit [Candidatus Micrarchaeota archaeon]|nr:V-type ATPase subunit [Candidatus Micrarchaeota archaeon]